MCFFFSLYFFKLRGKASEPALCLATNFQASYNFGVVSFLVKAKPSFLVSHCSTLVSSPPEKQQHCLPQGPSFRISGAQLDAWARLNPQALQQSPALMLPCQGGGSSLCLLCICQLPGEGFHYLGSLTCPNSHFQPSLHKRWGTKLIPGAVTTLPLSDQELKIQDTATWQVCTSSVL